jgi:hypothetical protein
MTRFAGRLVTKKGRSLREPVVQSRRFVERITSATVGPLMPGQSISTSAGGTRDMATSIAAVLIVTAAPHAIAAATSSPMAANQIWMSLERVMLFSTMSSDPCRDVRVAKM